MLTAILGPPASGKSTLTNLHCGRGDTLYLPLYWIRIAAHRKDRTRFWQFNTYQKLLDPELFLVDGTGAHKHSEAKLTAELCNNETCDESADISGKLVSFLISSIKTLWKDWNIVVEGELLEKSWWLNLVAPDRVILCLPGPVRKLPQTVRGGRPWPDPDVWTPKHYRKVQIRLLSLTTRWLLGEI